MNRTEATADEIRLAMQLTRERASAEIAEVVAGARELTDWRHYPRRFPWLTLGAAAMAGFAVIPRRAEPIVANAQALQDFADRHLRGGEQKARERGMLGALIVTLGTAALRMGLSAAGRELTRRWQVSQNTLREEFAS
ncbi:MAG: hypothetical protein JNG89_09570 [Planctomycetaceae bacterium]|nr:hypothetical protein [Planctomycetaceae bacterium]